jgi:hypothetical protein
MYSISSNIYIHCPVLVNVSGPTFLTEDINSPLLRVQRIRIIISSGINQPATAVRGWLMGLYSKCPKWG